MANSGNLSGATAVAVYHSSSTGKDYAVTTAYLPGALTVLDISNPASPTVVGTTSTASPNEATQLENGSNVAISGNYAFVVSKNRNQSTTSNDDGSGNSLTVVDLTNPASPTPLGTIKQVSSTNLGGAFGFYGVAVSGQFAYLAAQGILAGQPTAPDTSYGAFSVIDLATMQVVSTINNAGLPLKWTNALKHATSVQISGHYAYVTAFYDDRVTVIDISNPASPQIVASLRDATNLVNPADLAVRGNYVYVANQTGLNNQFTVVDVSNPASPKVVASLNNASLAGAYRIRVRGDFAYVAASAAASEDVIDISAPTNPRLVATVTDTAHLDFTTGLDLDSSGRYLVASSPRQNGQTGSTYPPFATNTGTISVIDLEPAGPVAVSIAAASEPPSATAQTSASFSFSTNESVYAVQCSLDGAAPAPCTSPTTMSYSGLSIGSHTFTVTATDSTGATSTGSYTWLVGTAPQSNGTPPAPSGSAVTGSTLTAASGSWSGSPAPTFSYQWMSCDSGGLNCVAIQGQTGSTYVVQSGDAGSTLAVDVTGSNSVSSTGPVLSAATAVVQSSSAPPTKPSPAPSVGGSAAAGQTLTASPGTWDGSPAPSVSYQWLRCDQSGNNCASISGANGLTYVVQQGDGGSTIEFSETATNSSGSASATTTQTATVTAPPQSTSTLAVSGTPKQGAVLSVNTGSWSGWPSPTSFAYQWSRCNTSGGSCSPIAGATASQYTTVRADVGSTVSVSVTASSSSGSGSASALSAAVAGAPVATTSPSVSGLAQTGATLTASPGTWTGYPTPTLAYSWIRCNATGTGCVTISGQTAMTYVIASADLGSTLRVSVTATNSSGVTHSPSTQTSVVVVGTAHAVFVPAVLSGVSSGHPKLSVTLPATSGPVQQITISLPKAIRLSRSRVQLLRGVTIRDAAGRKLRIVAVVSRGRLVITLRKPYRGVRVSLTKPAVTLSHTARASAGATPGTHQAVRIRLRLRLQ